MIPARDFCGPRLAGFTSALRSPASLGLFQHASRGGAHFRLRRAALAFQDDPGLGRRYDAFDNPTKKASRAGNPPG
jgi:hypothetical protein